jgi:hypothetical protein
MRKLSKILAIIALISMLALGFANISKADTEVDYTGYAEVPDEIDVTSTLTQTPAPTTTTTPATQTTPETPKPAENTNPAKKATTPAPQAGSFETPVIIAAASIVLVIAGIGYIKYKKYNF